MRLGKKPAREGAVKLRLRDYTNLSVLPTPPAEFGHDKSVTVPWGMLANDRFGDCFWAGAAHETMLWNDEAARIVGFTADAVLSDYASTGFDPGTGANDDGTDIQVGAKYRQDVGIVDADGNRHRIGAYLAIEPRDIEGILTACYLFSAVGVGLVMPSSAQAQFQNGQPWVPMRGSPIEGGHYVPLVARRAGLLVFVTWGAEHPATDDFFNAYNDEALAYVSPEFLTGGKSPEGFDLDRLLADLRTMKGAA